MNEIVIVKFESLCIHGFCRLLRYIIKALKSQIMNKNIILGAILHIKNRLKLVGQKMAPMDFLIHKVN